MRNYEWAMPHGMGYSELVLVRGASLMETLAEPEFVAETLVWCNERRKERGMAVLSRLPKGRRYDEGSCPCGKACGFQVGRYEYSETYALLYGYGDDHKKEAKPLPHCVTEFVDKFDGGGLPQYDETKNI